MGTFTMCHEALKYLKKGAPGRSSSTGGFILNISATLHYTASWYQIHVSAAKVCEIHFFLRFRLFHFRFLVNICVCISRRLLML